MPLIAHRNRPGNGGDQRFLFEYLESFNPFLEYRFNEASGNVINQGSDGATYDLSVAGNPVYQAGAGDAFGETGNFYLDMDGTGDALHNGNVATLTSKSEGAMVFLFRSDVDVSAELFIMKPEVGVGSFFQLFLQSGGVSGQAEIRLQINDGGGNVRRIEVRNSTNYRPGAYGGGTVTHLLVVQRDAIEGYKIWLDGVGMMNAVDSGQGENFSSGPAADNFWWDALSVTAQIFGIANRPEYNGSGSYVSSSVNLDGRMEYAAFFPAAFDREALNEMWYRFIGGFDELQGNGQGLDAITMISGSSQLASAGAPSMATLDRRNNNWIVRNDIDGYAERVTTQGGRIGGSEITLNDVGVDDDGLAIGMASGSTTSNTYPGFVHGGEGDYLNRALGTGSAEAFFGTVFYNPIATRENGEFIHAARAIATPFSDNMPAYRWNAFQSVQGSWNRLSFIDVAILNQVLTTSKRWLAVSADEQWAALFSKSVAGQSTATGGGGIHIHSVDNWEVPDPAEPNWKRQSIDGNYTPVAGAMKGGGFFNDGTDEYLICWGQGVTGAGGFAPGFGNTGQLGVLKRNSGTGVWEVQPNAIMDGGADPIARVPGASSVFEGLVTEDGDIYLAYWDDANIAALNYLVHLRWNGTTFAYVNNPEWPPVSVEAPPIPATGATILLTRDQRGVVIALAPLASDLPSNIIGYDRNPANGELTYRSDWFGGRILGGAAGSGFAQELKRVQNIGATQRDFGSAPAIAGFNP